MNVKDTSSVVPAATTRVVPGSGQSTQATKSSPVEDKVSVPTPQNAAALHTVASASNGRAARVAEIVNAVKSGQYYPSPQQIAQQLVSEAEVDARLQSLLAG